MNLRVQVLSSLAMKNHRAIYSVSLKRISNEQNIIFDLQ